MATKEKEKSNNSNHIRYLRKEIGNGDIDSEINKQLKTSRKNKVHNQLKKMKEPMKKFENDLQKKSLHRPLSTRIQNFNTQLKQDIRKVNENQKKLNQKLKNIPYSNKNNPNNFFSKKKRLPDTIQDIEDNTELAKLLLKNPDKMTNEEKVYIASFNDKEFDLFIKYLKMKDREIKWQGNGLGSGHYLEGFISIYRKYGSKANERFAKLNNFLKINYNNKKAKEISLENKKNMFLEENKFNGDNLGNAEEEFNFEQNNKELLKQFDLYKNILSEEKSKLEIKKQELDKINLEKKLEAEKRRLNEEINNLKENKNKNNEIEELYQKYITDSEITKDGIKINEQSLGKKLKNYLRNMGLDANEFSHIFIESNLPENLSITGHNYIFIPNAQKKLVELKILNPDESELICKILLNYSDEYIREDIFSHFIQGLIDDVDASIKSKSSNKHKNNKNPKKVSFIDDEKEKSSVIEESEQNEESESYDNNPEIKPSQKIVEKSEKLRQKIRGIYFSELENIKKNRFATYINNAARGFLIRKEVKIKRINTMIMVKRITRLLRKNYEEKMKYKNEAAKKITYLIKKNYWSKRDMKAMAHFSSRWLKQNKNLTILDKKNIAATFIQSTWKKHRLLVEQEIREYKNKITNEMLRSKICFICKKNKVYYLCKDCENNHYCEECFKLYHSRGNKRNHNFITISEIEGKDNDEKKITPEFIDKREIIKKYLNEHHLNLYQFLSMWDFKKNNTISYLNLQDALKVGGFVIDKKIQKAILEYSLKYVINGNRVLNHNKYIISLKFCTDFL